MEKTKFKRRRTVEKKELEYVTEFHNVHERFPTENEMHGYELTTTPGSTGTSTRNPLGEGTSSLQLNEKRTDNDNEHETNTPNPMEIVQLQINVESTDDGKNTEDESIAVGCHTNVDDEGDKNVEILTVGGANPFESDEERASSEFDPLEDPIDYIEDEDDSDRGDSGEIHTNGNESDFSDHNDENVFATDDYVNSDNEEDNDGVGDSSSDSNDKGSDYHDDDDDDDGNNGDDDDDGGGGGGGGDGGDDDDDDGDDDNGGDDDDDDGDDHVFNIEPGNVVTARPNIREGAIITLLIAVALRFKLSFTALLSIFGVIEFMLNQCNIPTTRVKLWKRLGRDEQKFQTRTIYCKLCREVIGNGKRPGRVCACEMSGPHKPLKNTSFSINLNLTDQLKRILAIPNIIRHLRYRYDRKKRYINNIEDIYDGILYKRLQNPGNFLSSQYNYSFTINTDGCQVGKSSSQSAWPVLLTINEFPPHLRKRYMILAGIYVDDGRPDLNAYISPIVNELRFLYYNGLIWRADGVTRVRSRFVTTTCVVDSVARYELLNMKSFNGLFGCTFCYAQGSRVDPRKIKRVHPVRDFRDRRDREMRVQMDKATRTGVPLWGIKGNTILKSLPSFDLRKSMVVDGMHNAFLGIVKTLMQLILDSPATCPWYIGSPANRNLIDERLLKIRTPSRIARKPRSINSYLKWKASEWRNWILYYAIPCLTDLLKEEYLSIFCKLSEALHIFNGDSISVDDLNRAHILIEQFVNEYERLFGPENMKYNFHIIRHMTKTIGHWGPMWANTAFIYEGFNKKIIESLHSPNGRQLQIMNKYVLNDFVRCVIHDPAVLQETKRKTVDIFNTGKQPPFRNNQIGHEIANFEGIGAPVSKEPDELQRENFRQEGITCRHRMNVYKKAVIKGNLYSSRGAERCETKSRNNIIYTNTKYFAEILSIVSFVDDGEQRINGAFIQYYDNIDALGQARHIRAVYLTSHIGFVLEDEIIAPAIIMKPTNVEYAVKMTNIWETD